MRSPPGTSGAGGGEIVPRLLLPLSLSYDHRVIDGGRAVLLGDCRMLENPLLMLL